MFCFCFYSTTLPGGVGKTGKNGKRDKALPGSNQTCQNFLTPEKGQRIKSALSLF